MEIAIDGATNTSEPMSQYVLTSTDYFAYDVGSYAKPFCADFDDDGDLDCLVGEYYGTVYYFQNEDYYWGP